MTTTPLTLPGPADSTRRPGAPAGRSFGLPAGDAFDLLGPLPTGTTVLEASAGTGKTFTIAGLVARYIGEGVASMDDLLVVSFSRESTRELRERVRERLVSARDGLTDPATIDPGDAVLAYLADASPAEVAARCRRLGEALAAFDAATVTTTHGFCQQVMLALGTAGDHDAGAVLVEDIGDLVREVSDDLYLRKWGVPDAGPAQLTPAQFRDLAAAVAGDPGTPLVPPPQPGTAAGTAAGGGGVPDLRARVAVAVRAEVDRRKRRQQVIDYDDLLLRLAATLADPVFGPAARARLRARYTVVLVDEFQDTDPVQWSILREPFHGHRTLVLIGDPKQAIYGFRGADVYAYLDAVRVADTVATLPTSYRGDALLLAGLAALFRGAALGDPRIRVLPVTAAHSGRMVHHPAAPVRLRVLPRDGLPLVRNGTAKTGDAREAVVADLAAEVVALLTAGTRVSPRDGGPERDLQPGDIAVLVRKNSQAQLVSTRLADAGVPVVVTGRASVFATAAASEWQLLLEALEQPHRTTRVRRLALSCFIGATASDLADHGDQVADTLALQLRSWARVLDERGVAALFEIVSLTRSLQSRVLARPGGERLLTDLRHIAQALNDAALEGQLGVTGVLAWLRRRIQEAAGDGGLERSRRLESDAAAVQVTTVHTSKGLEFPVVLVPFGWDFWAGHEAATATFHDTHDRRVRDVGGPGAPDWDAHLARQKRDELDEELRLTYVAVTRAQSHLIVWWAPTFNTPQAPLHRLLLNPDPAAVAPASIDVPTDTDAATAFQRLAAGSGGGLAIEPITPRPPAVWTPPAQPATTLTAATLGRVLDLSWRRTSYSALTAAAHTQPGLGSEPDITQTDDETDLNDPPTATPGQDPDPDDGLRAITSAWDPLPSGAGFGTLIHELLEALDDPGDPTALAAATTTAAAGGSGVDVAALTAGLTLALTTPLGPLAAGMSLQQIPGADRLRELDFELPLAGGDAPATSRVMLADLVPLWRRHCPTGPLAGYADALTDLEPAPLRGYLTGSIDVVLRVTTPTSPNEQTGQSERNAVAGPAEPGVPRYLVVDYKTNRLGGYDEPLTAWHYRPEAMERAMIEAHYPLQALLYQVALHRYLRWRQPGYDPDTHLGGAMYLFLRGMSGADLSCADGSRPGVFAWRPPTGLVTDVSDLLAATR